MADRSSIEVAEFLGKQLETASPDLLREMIKTFAEALMGADADNVCNAAYRERSDEPTNSRNGYRERPWDTRAGSIELRVPKLGHDSCFPDWLLGRRTRAEQALISVVATAYLLGVSTRRVQTLVQTSGSRSCPAVRSARWPSTSTCRCSRFATGRPTPAPTPTCGSTRWS